MIPQDTIVVHILLREYSTVIDISQVSIENLSTNLAREKKTP